MSRMCTQISSFYTLPLCLGCRGQAGMRLVHEILTTQHTSSLTSKSWIFNISPKFNSVLQHPEPLLAPPFKSHGRTLLFLYIEQFHGELVQLLTYRVQHFKEVAHALGPLTMLYLETANGSELALSWVCQCAPGVQNPSRVFISFSGFKI
ncbi:hypothetical protein M413DRAFT_258917 [Hebeloma cylindrosporum]|uniref:Uncharacterized protein n=1 Tax=Hebeloma cylindrosporum TaxID=76867 RepID=A0A0C3BLT2_HEBCY|nr:hypothetical protein M413DRAFT_258917 [Hebeloma cylindrosporum h7]